MIASVAQNCYLSWGKLSRRACKCQCASRSTMKKPIETMEPNLMPGMFRNPKLNYSMRPMKSRLNGLKLHNWLVIARLKKSVVEFSPILVYKRSKRLWIKRDSSFRETSLRNVHPSKSRSSRSLLCYWTHSYSLSWIHLKLSIILSWSRHCKWWSMWFTWDCQPSKFYSESF